MVKRGKVGLWLELRKQPAAERPIEEPTPPKRLIIPLNSNDGLLLSRGAGVFMGQPIAQSADGTQILSTVSGRIADTADYSFTGSSGETCVIIENDGRDTPYRSPQPQNDAESLSAAQILYLITYASVTSFLDGTPLCSRLQIMAHSKIKTLVVNAVETEPYVCVSQKIMDESADKVARGLSLLMKCTGAASVMLAVSDDLPPDISKDMAESAHMQGFELKIAHVPQKYPSGYERYLTQRLCHDVDGDVRNAGIGFVYPEECLNVCRAVCEGHCQLAKVITVAGDAVETPQNLSVRIGTPVRFVLEYCRLKFDPDRVVLGGAMRGTAITNLDAPVVSGVSAVLALRTQRRTAGKAICINCGKCASVCPEGLLPNYIARYAINADFDSCRRLAIDRCIECGLCSYICPGHMPIVELIKNLRRAEI